MGLGLVGAGLVGAGLAREQLAHCPGPGPGQHQCQRRLRGQGLYALGYAPTVSLLPQRSLLEVVGAEHTRDHTAARKRADAQSGAQH